MYCTDKDNLYRTLIRIDQFDRARGVDLSPEYVACVDAIKAHDHTGHNGKPCPDAGY